MTTVISRCVWSRLRRSVLALGMLAAAGSARAEAPYAPSPYITAFNLKWSSYRVTALGSDLWPTSWAADGKVYTSWGDGGGFGTNSEALAYVSIGIARITGTNAARLAGQNLISGLKPTIALCFPLLPGRTVENRKPQPGTVLPCLGKGLHGKSTSILALDDQLYLWVNPRSGNQNLKEARLYKAPIGTNQWQDASWALTPTGTVPLVEPAFLQAGKNYGDIPDFVYAYAARYAPTATLGLQKGSLGGSILLLRAPRGTVGSGGGNLLDRASWQFYAGTNAMGAPVWSGDQSAARAVFTDPQGVGFTNAAIYVKALDRYLLLTQHTAGNAGQLGLFEARQPWGSWHTVFYGVLQSQTPQVKPFSFYANFLANSFSVDGLKFTLAFTGIKKLDALSLVDGSFVVNPAAK